MCKNYAKVNIHVDLHGMDQYKVVKITLPFYKNKFVIDFGNRQDDRHIIFLH